MPHNITPGLYKDTSDNIIAITYVHLKSPFTGEEHKWPLIGWHEKLGACCWTKEGKYTLEGESNKDLVLEVKDPDMY